MNMNLTKKKSQTSQFFVWIIHNRWIRPRHFSTWSMPPLNSCSFVVPSRSLLPWSFFGAHSW